MKEALAKFLSVAFTIIALPIILPICGYFLFRIRQRKKQPEPLERQGLPYQRRNKTLILIALLATTPATAEVYTLRRVKRIDADLYRGGNIYFKTRYCYHYTNSEDVILEWDGRRGKVVWDDDTTCQVVDVFRKAAY